jgi:hypothetical protein
VSAISFNPKCLFEVFMTKPPMIQAHKECAVFLALFLALAPFLINPLSGNTAPRGERASIAFGLPLKRQSFGK